MAITHCLKKMAKKDKNKILISRTFLYQVHCAAILLTDNVFFYVKIWSPLENLQFNTIQLCLPEYVSDSNTNHSQFLRQPLYPLQTKHPSVSICY